MYQLEMFKYELGGGGGQSVNICAYTYLRRPYHLEQVPLQRVQRCRSLNRMVEIFLKSLRQEIVRSSSLSLQYYSKMQQSVFQNPFLDPLPSEILEKLRICWKLQEKSPSLQSLVESPSSYYYGEEKERALFDSIAGIDSALLSVQAESLPNHPGRDVWVIGIGTNNHKNSQCFTIPLSTIVSSLLQEFTMHLFFMLK